MAARKTPRQKPKTAPVAEDRFLPKLTTAFFDRPVLTIVLWLMLAVFGVASYTTLLKREGFPSVQIPLNVVSGTYAVNDPSKVDAEVAKLVAETALKQPDIKQVQTTSNGNFFTATVTYKEGTDAANAAADLEKAVKGTNQLPSAAALRYSVPNFGVTGPDQDKIDLAISLYILPYLEDSPKPDRDSLVNQANELAKSMNDQKVPGVKQFFVKNPREKVVDPATGAEVVVQKSFDRYGVREQNNTGFYNSVIIGVEAEPGVDAIDLNNNVQKRLDVMNSKLSELGFKSVISASFAPQIKENISELQRVLLEGLLVILIVGSVVIAVRASVITVIAMITVLLSTLGFIYVVGYTLNVITLFALILGLSLIVDDTIIMVEAIDAARRHQKDRRKTVEEATRKISRAMVAATLTASLSFAPLAFVGGVLGSFIRAIPIVIIASLLISLLVALIFIPFFARVLLLGKRQMGQRGVKEVAAGFESKIANKIAVPMQWARQGRARLAVVCSGAVLIGIGFILAAGVVGKDVVFNIFPPTKDTNGLAVTLIFPPDQTLQQTEQIAVKAEAVVDRVVGNELVRASYFASGGIDTATLQVELTPYTKRDIRSPQIVSELQSTFDREFKEAQAIVAQADVGPPGSTFAVQITANDRAAAQSAAKDLAAYLPTAQLKRINGSTARLVNVSVGNQSQYLRSDQRPIVTVTANFDAKDTTTLVTLAKDAITERFTAERLSQYGLKTSDLTFDLGQESENQDSFKALLIAFPVLLLAMFVLLAVQFRSFLQPLLIFLAIPFSLFGIMLGLRLTDNAVSFFAMMGFFALLGLSIKNTILLTDSANQARRRGLGPVDAAITSLQERFRPLLATSLTAAVALIPLAITSPFWEGLAVVLIFGLLSSTFLVITVFPYYYLAAEFLRRKFRARYVLAWLIVAIGGSILVSMVTQRQYIILWLLVFILLRPVYFVGQRVMSTR